MTLIDHWQLGKYCFIYCGDDRCDCDRSPYYPGNIKVIKGRESTIEGLHYDWKQDGRITDDVLKEAEELNELVKKIEQHNKDNPNG